MDILSFEILSYRNEQESTPCLFPKQKHGSASP